jgi:hypothetical protein
MIAQSSRYEKCYVFGNPVMPTLAQNGTILTASTTTTGVTYQWLLNGATISGVTGATYSPTQSGDYQVIASNSVGCQSDTSAVLPFVVVTGTNNPQNSTELAIFPNPTNNILHLRGTAIEQTVFDVHIYNMYGSLLKTAHSQQDIDLNGLANGVYSVKVTAANNAIYTQKITLMR